MNDLEIALAGSDEELSEYLELVPTCDFRAHITDLKHKCANREPIKAAIEMLQGLLSD